MTSENFRNRFEMWLRTVPSKNIQVVSRAGRQYALIHLDGENSEEWTILIDSNYNPLKIVRDSVHSITTFEFHSVSLMRSGKHSVASFASKVLPDPIFRFNDRHEFVRIQHYHKLFVVVDSSLSLQLILGVSITPDTSPQQTFLLASFPLKNTTIVPPAEPGVPQQFTEDEKTFKEPCDIADCDLDDKTVLLLYADRGFP